jgi:SOS response regulatory protein OraA/RecX
MHGPYKIKNNLLNLGFKEEQIDLYLAKVDDKVWEDKIKKLITKRKKLNKKGNTKEKTYIYLFNLGYENRMIYSLLGDISEY